MHYLIIDFDKISSIFSFFVDKILKRHHKFFKLQSRTLGFIPLYSNKRQIRNTSLLLITSYKHERPSLYLIPKRFVGTNKVANTVVKAASSDSSKLTTSSTPTMSTNNNQVNVNRPLVSARTYNYTNNNVVKSEHIRENRQFLKKVDTLAEKAEQANVSAEIGVQTPQKWLKQPIAVVFKKADASRVMEYEDTKEFKSSGSPRLTRTGLKIFREIHNSTTTLDQPHIQNQQTRVYEVGLLKVKQETEVLTPEQNHLLVVYSTNNNGQRVGLGYLTSKKDQNTIELSKDQPISGNPNKSQNLAVFDKPLLVDQQYFDLHNAGTAYIQGYISKIEEIQKESIDKAHRVYDGNGVSLAELQLVTRTNLVYEKNKVDLEEARKAKLNVHELRLEQKGELNRQKVEHKNKIDFSKFDEDDYK